MTFEGDLQSRVSKYLSRPTVQRPPLKGTLDAIKSSLPETVIFGGMIREIALGGAKSFSSDIDLVSLATQDEIQDVTDIWAPVKNKFGGFRFVVGRQRFDIWSLDDTWAFRAGFADDCTFLGLLGTSFFNLDAVCLHLTTGKITFATGYGSAVANRLLDINLAANPHPDRMARKAITLALKHDLGLTSRLAAYIGQNISRGQLVGTELLFVRELDFYLRDSRATEFKFLPQLQLG